MSFEYPITLLDNLIAKSKERIEHALDRSTDCMDRYNQEQTFIAEESEKLNQYEAARRLLDGAKD